MEEFQNDNKIFQLIIYTTLCKYNSSQQHGNPRQGGQGQAPGKINITVQCTLDTGELEFQQSVDPTIPFKELVSFLQQTVFAQQMESNYEKTIDYTVGRQMITASEIRTLENLGVKDGDTIKMKLKLKGG
ncbi:hypothetical protein pb186bvf_008255 [Paramecium bursaria]